MIKNKGFEWAIVFSGVFWLAVGYVSYLVLR